jgi:hypothetical protein
VFSILNTKLTPHWLVLMLLTTETTKGKEGPDAGRGARRAWQQMRKTASELTRNGVRKLIKKLTRQRREAERWCAFYRFQRLKGQGYKAFTVLFK